MSTVEQAKQLHDRATRGTGLSAAEQTQLDVWYAEQDQEEGALLTQIPPPQTLVALQAQVDAAVARLIAVTQRLQELVRHNEVLRHDIAALQQRLPPSSPLQSA